MTEVFSGTQWTTPSGSTWTVLIEPDFVNEVAELCNHLGLASAEARSASEEIVTRAQAASGDDGTTQARKDVVKSILEAVQERGLNQGAEAKDLEGFTNLTVALINATFEQNESDSLLIQLADGLIRPSQKESKTAINARYSSLSSLFNSLSDSTIYETRASILLSLFKLAVSRDDLSILSSALTSLPDWLSHEWGISDSAASDKIVATVVEVLEHEGDNSSEQERHEAIRLLLLAYANENTDDTLKSKLLLYTLASNTTFSIELLPSISPDSQLAKIKEIFLSGTLEDLSNASSDLPAPLYAEKLKENMQYVILADYCSSKVGQTISYEEVASVLGLKGEGDEEDRAMEIEAWIIATIRVKLLAARLHQPSNTVSILRATPRIFGKEQWTTLQRRLQAWKASVDGILDTVRRAVGQGNRPERPSHDAQGAVQAAGALHDFESPVIEVA